MWYRGLMLVSSIVFVASANAQQQQQDTTKHGWGIVYSSPKSRASSTTPASGISPTAPPAAPAQSQVTTFPTIPPRSTPANTAPAPTPPAYTPPPPANGAYMGDRPPASAPAVAAQGTYDTIPPAPASGGGGVHLDELMSLHEYTSTGLTNLKPQEVQALEIWLERYRANLVDSVTRATQRTSQAMPLAPAAAPPAVANTRSVAPVNTHTVTGIRSGSRFVQIDDGSVWDIYPADQTETAAWQVGDNVTVRVAAQAYGEFDHELVNGQRTGPVRAKFMGYARGQ